MKFRFFSLLGAFCLGFCSAVYSQSDELIESRLEHPLYQPDRVSAHATDSSEKRLTTSPTLAPNIVFLTRKPEPQESDELGEDEDRRPTPTTWRPEEDRPVYYVSQTPWKDLLGGVWFELVDQAPGVAFKLGAGDALPNLAEYGRVRIFFTQKKSNPLKLRFSKEFNFARGKDKFEPEENVGEWLLSLFQKKQLSEADYIQGAFSTFSHLSAVAHEDLFMNTRFYPEFQLSISPQDEFAASQLHPEKNEGYWLEDLSRPGLLVFYPSNFLLPKPEQETTVAVYEKSDLREPLVILKTTAYPSGASLQNLSTTLRKSKSSTKKDLTLVSKLELDPSSVVQATKDLVYAEFDSSGLELRYHLPISIAEKIGPKSNEKLNPNEESWAHLMGLGYWVHMPGIEKKYFWKDLSQPLRIPPDEKIEIYHSLQPKRLRYSGLFKDVKEKVMSARKARDLKDEELAKPIALQELLAAFPESCGGMMTQVGGLLTGTDFSGVKFSGPWSTEISFPTQ